MVESHNGGDGTTDSLAHRRYPSLESKLNILHRCFKVREDIKSVSEDTSYSRASIYSRRRIYLNGSASVLMSKTKHLPRGEWIDEESTTIDADQEKLKKKEKR